MTVKEGTLSPEQKKALDDYWSADSAEAEREAHARMVSLGLPDSYLSERPARVEIHHFKTIARTPALKLAVAGWLELLEGGRSDGGIVLSWDQEVIMAADASGPVGVLTWTDQAWSNQLVVNLAYVIPTRRRQGVHTAMWRALIGKALELKRPAIVSGTAIGNVPARSAMLEQGRRETGIVVTFEVPPADAAT